MKNEAMQKRLSLGLNSSEIPEEKVVMGSISGKYPVVLNDGRTVIFISDKSKETEIRLKYESLKDNKYPTRCPRHHNKFAKGNNVQNPSGVKKSINF